MINEPGTGCVVSGVATGSELWSSHRELLLTRTTMKHLLAATALALCATNAWAQSYQAGDKVIPEVGLTAAEYNCLLRTADPISACHIPAPRVARAMDQLLTFYRSPTATASVRTWVETHCKAVPAIPRNKWVCTEGDVTQEYR